ncbi:hypothetical protein KPH14_008729 [Odynerus spinipes]|uniref:BLUF domain-containing protein n=1 Tax=Odynerus spinipes TaxID=1348599 RepID=A0AAD9VHN6_9HYME|nr:hypothetical protein KPH14_008729 [Odynerus spinipes]
MTEKERQSLLDVVKKNLKQINYSTYITRFVYFGEYFHSSEELQEILKSIITELRVDCGENLVTGLLLVYPKYYIHLLEAPEDVIYMHFKLIYKDKNEDQKFGKAIFLPTYHHVYHKFFTNWFHVFTSAPSLLESIEKQTVDEIKKQISSCFMKFYHLCNYLSKEMSENPDEVDDILCNLNEKIPQYLPESTILEYLLNVKSSILKTVEDYLQIYNDVPFIQFYNDTIWPPPLDNMPHYALEKSRDRKRDKGDKKVKKKRK